MYLRAIRGAVTATENTKENIFSVTTELVSKMLDENNIETKDICDIIFTVTPDITAAFPAAAVRKMGICDVPLLDMSAPCIENALKMCIRVMMHINTDLENSSIRHIYLGGAKVLRPDLVKRNKISVAIDGPAGAGKSSVAKKVAENLGYVYIDTGAMYRTVAVWAIEKGLDTKSDKDKIVKSVNDIKIDIKYEDGIQKMFLDGKDVSDRIRKNDASMGASDVATIPEVRERLVDMQREMASFGGVIVDGRDIGTVVLPNAELKIFLTASVEERALRRYKEYVQKGIDCNLDKIREDVIKRDENDTNREVSPLRRSDDAVLFDTTEKEFDAVVGELEEMIKKSEEDK